MIIRKIHPRRLMRYAIYMAVAGAAIITLYTLLSEVGLMGKEERHSKLKVKNRVGQQYVDYIADHLHVKCEILSHMDYRTKAQITLKNSGPHAVKRGNWSLYIFYMSPIDTDMFNYGSGLQPRFQVHRIQGNYYKLMPSNLFGLLLPGDSVVLQIVSGTWMMAFTDLLPNWYVHSPETEARILKQTEESSNREPHFVEPFSGQSARKRTIDDPLGPLTPEDRFRKKLVKDYGKADHLVLPTPLQVEPKGIDGETVNIGPLWKIMALKDLANEAKILSDHFALNTVETRPAADYILLTIGNVPLTQTRYQHSPEAYYVDINHDVITICGQSAAGVYYGVQTLLSMASDSEGDNRRVPRVRVSDAPRFPYRGIMVDLARNFHSDKAELLRLIDALALYKMNKLHLHLADDEGWRLEIPGLEELTQIGAHRCHDPKETNCIFPALGSGPYANGSGSGFLSAQEYRELLHYATSRHIEVIPEFDMPGHGRAAIHSMQIRYKRKMALGDKTSAEMFLLSDVEDASLYMSGQYFTDNAINPCLESTYIFVDYLIRAVKALHEGIAPLKRFHFGGDEVPENAYMDSPRCRAYMQSHPELGDTKDLKIHFIKRIAAIAAHHDLGLQGWEDAFYGKDVLPMNLNELHGKKEVVTNVWWNMWEAGIGHRANELANANYKVVLSHATHFYFDHVQEPDPDERGLYWAIRYIDAKRAFSYIPDDIYENIDQRGMGEPWSREQACAQAVNCVALRNPQNVIGLQAQMWAETVRTRSQQNYMLFPRVLALAERGWHKAPWEDMRGTARHAARQADWESFANTLGYRELRRLEALDVHYRLPPPGAIFENDLVKVTSEYPGLPVVYSLDNGGTWQDVPKPGLRKQSVQVLLATRSFDGRRRSRTIVFNFLSDPAGPRPRRRQTVPSSTRPWNPPAASTTKAARNLPV